MSLGKEENSRLYLLMESRKSWSPASDSDGEKVEFGKKWKVIFPPFPSFPFLERLSLEGIGIGREETYNLSHPMTGLPNSHAPLPQTLLCQCPPLLVLLSKGHYTAVRSGTFTLLLLQLTAIGHSDSSACLLTKKAKWNEIKIFSPASHSTKNFFVDSCSFRVKVSLDSGFWVLGEGKSGLKVQ
jgi:hypothetical protein